MLLLLVSLAAVGGPPPTVINSKRIGPLDNSCQRPLEKAALVRPVEADITGSAPKAFHKLGDLPDANMEIAVNRLVDGCTAPLTIIHNVMAPQR